MYVFPDYRQDHPQVLFQYWLFKRNAITEDVCDIVLLQYNSSSTKVVLSTAEVWTTRLQNPWGKPLPGSLLWLSCFLLVYTVHRVPPGPRISPCFRCPVLRTRLINYKPKLVNQRWGGVLTASQLDIVCSRNLIICSAFTATHTACGVIVAKYGSLWLCVIVLTVRDWLLLLWSI